MTVVDATNAGVLPSAVAREGPLATSRRPPSSSTSTPTTSGCRTPGDHASWTASSTAISPPSAKRSTTVSCTKGSTVFRSWHAGRSRGAHHRASTAQARLAAQGKESPRATSRPARSRRWPPPRGRCRPCGREDGLAQAMAAGDHRDDRVHRGQDGGDGQLPGLDGNEVVLPKVSRTSDQHEGQQQVAAVVIRSR